MNVLKIDGKVYDVLIVDFLESFEILYSSNSGRTIATGAPMRLEALGTFFTYKLEVRRKQGFEKEYDALYNYLAQPRDVTSDEEGLEVEVVHNQETWNFKAYVSKGARKLKRVDEKTGKVYWDGMTINIVPIKAQVAKYGEN